MTLRERVEGRIIVAGENECWGYAGNHDKDGYAQITARFSNGRRRNFRVSRLLLEWSMQRSLYPRAYACHTCDHPGCVNLAHLYEGDHRSNTADSVRRNRRPRGEAIKTHIRWQHEQNPELQVRGERHGRAKLVADQVREIKRLHREDRWGTPRLSKAFGVSIRAVRSILDGVNWKHLDD